MVFVLNSALCDESEVQDTCLNSVDSKASSSECFTTNEGVDSTHLIGAWMQTRTGLDAVGSRNISHCRKLNRGRPARMTELTWLCYL